MWRYCQSRKPIWNNQKITKDTPCLDFSSTEGSKLLKCGNEHIWVTNNKETLSMLSLKSRKLVRIIPP